MNTPEPNVQPPTFSDVDLLTGCFNLVRFSKDIEENFGNVQLHPLTLITLDFYQLKQINQQKGFEHGDQLLRWLGILLRDEMGNAIYRISGQHFVAVMAGEPREAHTYQARHLFDYINTQAHQLGLGTPVVRMAVIHFPDGQPLTTAWVWKNINEKMERVKRGKAFLCVKAEALTTRDKKVIHAIELMAHRIVGLGQMMNVTFNNAYTDPVSNLPNVIAVQRRLELILAEAKSSGRHFSLILLDGDDLKRYNAVSYAAGDELIKQMSITLKTALRSQDFVGRWRFGDEFVILLPDTSLEDALLTGDRTRQAIQTESQNWLYPTTISAGVVHFPTHGTTLEALIEKAQLALADAKSHGKNRILTAH
ncbi:MAG: GGDEF domain-containing protein [Anaerolineales bacterium]